MLANIYQHQIFLINYKVIKIYIMPFIPKNKAGSIIGGIICLIIGVIGFINGYNSPEQWRQSFGIVSFIFMTAIFIVSIIGVYKNKG
jgi:hypothetical protein